jgi:hypothetical protein
MNDAKLRQLYGNKWARQPSSYLNQEYLGKLQDYKIKLISARTCDEGIKNNILEYVKYFEL